jgi:hypothetical protein
MTVLDVLASRVDAFMYVGATLAGLGFLVGVAVTLFLTATVRGHGYFHIMLEKEAARHSEDIRQIREAKEHDCATSIKINEDRALSETMIKMWDDIYYEGFAADDSDEDDEPDFNSWAGNDPWLVVADAAADELPGEELVGSNYVVPAEAATAVEPEPGLSIYWNGEKVSSTEWHKRNEAVMRRNGVID